jgi:molybdenum cofactor guanylyltransferase
VRSAAILVGGKATRFGGRDKSALVVEGRSIFERQVTELSNVVEDIMIVGAAAAAPDLRAPHAGRPPVRGIADIVPGCGPLGGLHAALSAAQADHVFVVACDMPYVNAALVDYLFSLAGEGAIVVPETDRGYHPLCAVYARACLEPVAARIAERRLALRALIDDVPARVVSRAEIARFGAPSQLLANVNTPGEYADLEAIQGHKL